LRATKNLLSLKPLIIAEFALTNPVPTKHRG
jgi:hypothetical protein